VDLIQRELTKLAAAAIIVDEAMNPRGNRDGSMAKQAINLNVTTRDALKRTPELSKELSEIVNATLKRHKQFDLRRILASLGGVTAGAGTSNALAGSLGLASISPPVALSLLALGLGGAATAGFIMPAIQDMKLRKKLKQALGDELGEEVANLSQRSYNKSQSFTSRNFPAPIGFLGDIGRTSRAERAAREILRSSQNLDIDPSMRVGPYSRVT